MRFIYILPFLFHVCSFSQGTRICRIAGDSTLVNGFAGDNGPALTSKMDFPSSVSIDSLGNIYFSDVGNYRVRMINKSTGIITTVAGGGSNPADGNIATQTQLNGLGYITVDKNLNIYLTDGNSIRKVDGQTGIVNTIAGTYGTSGYTGDGGQATAATMNAPGNLSLDEIRNYLFLCDQSNHCVRKIDLSTGIINTIAGTGLAGFSGDSGIATSAQLNFPTGVCSDSAGNIYISDSQNSRIRKINAGSNVITTFAGTTMGLSGDNGLAISAQLSSPYSLTFDKDFRHLYFADTYNSAIRKIAMATGIISRTAGTGVSGYSGDGGPAVQAELNWPMAVALSKTGDIVIADAYNNLIREIPIPTWPYHPMPDSNAVWNFRLDHSCVGPIYEEYSLFLNGDTIINSASFHKLYVNYVQTNSTSCHINLPGYQGAYRQDIPARMVYYVPPSTTTEYLLYDFKWQTGDSITGYLRTQGASYDVVHGVDSVLVGGTYRRRLHINYTYDIRLIEGVGSTYGLFKPSVGEIIDTYSTRLTCFSQNTQSLYPDTITSCDYITSLSDDQKANHKIKVYPNPANDSFTIELNANSISNINMLNTLGEIVQTYKTHEEKIIIRARELNPGTYFLVVISKEGVLSERILINH